MRRVFEVKVYREDEYGLYHLEAANDLLAREQAVTLDDAQRLRERLASKESPLPPTPAVQYCETKLVMTLDN